MGANEKHAATYHGGEYTPSTDVVLAAYMECEKRHVRTPDEKAISAFDRWLETVRAEAKAEALEEAASEIYRLDGDDAEMYNEDLNATPVTVWLRDRANQYKENQ